MPEYLLRKLIAAAIRKGDPTVLRQVYKWFVKLEVPDQEYIDCGKSAIRNLDPYAAIAAYTAAKTWVPTKAMRALANKLSDGCRKEDFNLRDVIHAFEYIDELPQMDIAINIGNAIHSRKNMHEYRYLCKFLKRDMDPEILENFLQYWQSKLSFGAVINCMKLLNRKPSKKYLIKMSKLAFANGQEDDGEAFLKEAYKNF